MQEKSEMISSLFGRLSWDAIPLHVPIIMGTFAVVAVAGIALLAVITRFGLWGYLWREWFTTIDHKKIGIMYIVLAIVMLLRGFADALMMRLQQALAFGDSAGYLPPEHYDQIFSAHGVIMIFFVAMPLVIGLINVAMPLQIGARDVAFPMLNSVSFWFTAVGAALTMLSLFVGEYSRTGWLAYPPLSELSFSPDTGVDYFIWSMQIAGLGSLFTGINMVVTIIKMRAPGMTMMKMPIFSWTSFCASVLLIAAFPVFTGVLFLLSLDRYVGTNFFVNDLGGNPMMYINMIWIWGHPEVYILVLPAFGIFSEVVSTFSGKRLFGYNSMVYATVCITVLSYIVWLHHFFTMGSGETVNSFFALATMIISIPTGAKMYNWLFTMYRGRIRFEVPMLWTMGFMLTFGVGGLTGVLLAVPAADFELHNNLFLVAHFHNVIIGGVLAGLMAGITFWFPKSLGFRLAPFWGKCSFWFWMIGFGFATIPQYMLGLMGVQRRMNHFDDPALQIYFQLMAFGAVLILFGILSFVMQLYVSFRDRDQLRDTTGDPWTGRTLEWSTASPAPVYNFAFTPIVHDIDAWADMKERGYKRPLEGFIPIHMPKNTGAGVVISAFAFIWGFALVWHIWWLAAVSFVALIGTVIQYSFNYKRDFYIPVDEIARTEAERTRLLAQQAGS